MIGVLATAVVALGVVVAVLLVNDDGSATTTTQSGGPTTTSTQAGQESCEVKVNSIPAELDLRSSGLTCDQATAIVDDFQQKASYVTGSPVPVRGPWSCKADPFASYPLVAFCAAPDRRILVTGTGPGPHGGSPDVQSAPLGTKAACSGATNFGFSSISADGVRCSSAIAIANAVGEVCFSAPSYPSPCYVTYGFGCFINVGNHPTAIRCDNEGRSVRFKFNP